MVRTSIRRQSTCHSDEMGRTMKMQAIAQMVSLGAGGLGASVGAVKSLGFVPEGHVGVKLRWGKVVRYGCDKYDREGKKIHSMGDVIYYGPGWRWIIPWTHKFRTVSLLEQVMHLPERKYGLADQMIFKVRAVVNFQVNPDIAYKALYKVDSYQHALESLCLTELRECLGKKSYQDLCSGEEINASLFEAIHAIAYEKWGIEVLSFKLEETEADEHTKSLIQLAQAVKIRVDLLQNHAAAMSGIDVAMASVLLGSGTVIASSISTNPYSGTENEGKVLHLGVVPEQPSPA
jgi:regulator of protease activity HflC (stomatin/prohibitin superfamily)